MKLKQLSLSHYRGFEQLDIAFEDDITVIAGVNGVGKSSVLNAIAQIYSHILPQLSLSRAKTISVSDDDIYMDNHQSSITAKFVIKNREWVASLSKQRGKSARLGRIYPVETVEVPQTKDILERKKDARQLLGFLRSAPETESAPLVVYFSPKRQMPDRPRSMVKLETQGIAVAYREALNDREVQLRDFMHWFRTQEALGAEDGSSRATVLDSLRRVVSELVPEFTNLRIEESPRLGFVVEKEGKSLYLHQLSDGERGLLALVFDLTRRLAIANPVSNNPIAEGVALVLIDELELHLHPKWQRQVIRRLREVFKSCQFIITSHSPQVIGQVKAEKLRLFSHDESGKVALSPVTQAFGMDSSWVLQNIMGVPARDYETEQRLSMVFDAIDEGQYDVARKLAEEMRAEIGDFPDLQEAVALLDRFELLAQG